MGTFPVLAGDSAAHGFKIGLLAEAPSAWSLSAFLSLGEGLRGSPDRAPFSAPQP